MLAIPHLLTGALIGKVAEGVPYALPIAFVLGWLSHYILDSIPHWESYFPNKNNPYFETDDPISKWPKSVLLSIFLDFTVGFFLIFFYLRDVNFWQTAVFWGSIGAIAPDIIDNVPFWNRYVEKIPVLGSMRKFHQSIHISNDQKKYPKYLGLVTQLIVITIVLWIF